MNFCPLCQLSVPYCIPGSVQAFPSIHSSQDVICQREKEGDFLFKVTSKSVQVTFVPYCCLFYVLSNDMLNVSVGTFLRRYMHQRQDHSIICTPLVTLISHLCVVNKMLDLMCVFPNSKQ